MASLDWFPTFVAVAGNPRIVDDLKAGVKLGKVSYKVHLDGYNQLPMLTQGAASARNEFFYFAEANLGSVRIGDYKYIFL
jgi:arylsulfatase A-like enzyme